MSATVIRPPVDIGPEPPAAAPALDWDAASRSRTYTELVSRRRRFVLPATIGFLVWYFGFIILAGYAPEFMGTSIHHGLTVGYALALSQFIMVWGLALSYLRYSDRVLDPLRERTARTAVTGQEQA